MSIATPLPPKQLTTVNGHRLAHVELGCGDPIVLLHGNPTSSYLWRDVMPPLAGLGRVIAPDLIGHGDSDKLPASDGPGRYTLEGTYDLLAAQLSALGADQRVTLVLHDWGSALGFHWARLHPQQVRGIAYMEAIVMPIPSWDDWPEKARGIFQGFRSPKGEDLVLKRNLFIEGVLPSSILRKLSDDEMAVYRAPFAREEDRQPMLNWPRQIPIAGEPPNVVALVQQYAQWLSTSPVPKLPVHAIVNLHVTDAATYRQYEKGFFPLLKKYGGEFVTYDDAAFTLEGTSPRTGRMIIFKFPSEAQARAWYADPEYQALSEHRRAGTRMEFLTMVRGLPPR